MRLADFILRDMESILVEWEAFAHTLVRARGMDSLTLRDHAEKILQAIAKDIRTAQSDEAQAEKSMGRAPRRFDAPETAAETHATLRARAGFDIEALASEYRALRASVLRLWAEDCGDATLHVDDVIRFNEAIDQALAESIGFFSAEVEQARNLLLGMLGHDMRSPLQTIQLTASYLTALNAGAEVTDASRRLVTSGARMKALLDDLVDFNRTTLGLGINIEPAAVDLAALFRDEVELQRGAHPGQRFDYTVVGGNEGHWDGLRLQQLLGNLLRNAAKYGAAGAPISVDLRGGTDEVRFEVLNLGPPIPAEALTCCSTRCSAAATAGSATTAPASAWACTSRARSPRRTAARSGRPRTRPRPCSRCGCPAHPHLAACPSLQHRRHRPVAMTVAATTQAPMASETAPIQGRKRSAVGTVRPANRWCHCHGMTSSTMVVTTRTQPAVANTAPAGIRGASTSRAAPAQSRAASSAKCARGEPPKRERKVAARWGLVSAVAPSPRR